MTEMSTSEIRINPVQIPPGWGVQPPAQPGHQQAAQKQKSGMGADEALNLLKLVNVGPRVLDVGALNLSPEEAVLLAENIKSARKSGMGVEFENGRIHVPEQLFDGMLRGCKKGPDAGLSAIQMARPQINYTKAV